MQSSIFDGSEPPAKIVRKRPRQQNTVAHKFFGDKGKKEVTLPAITHAYNINMNGVDIGDQIHQYNNYHHAIRRGHFQAIYLLFYHGRWALCPLMLVPILIWL